MGPFGNGTEYAFTASPSYHEDHTVFASGLSSSRVHLLKSVDGGRSWTPRRADGLGYATVLLQPSYPRDPRIFAVWDRWLSVSHDDGHSFRALVPVAGPPSMSPLFSAGEPRILFGAIPGAPVATEYRDGSDALTPLAFQLPENRAPTDFFLKHLTVLPDGTLLFGAEHTGPPVMCSVDGGHTWAARCPRG